MPRVFVGELLVRGAIDEQNETIKWFGERMVLVVKAPVPAGFGDVFGDLPPPVSRNAAGHVVQPNSPSVIPMGPPPAVPQQPDSL